MLRRQAGLRNWVKLSGLMPLLPSFRYITRLACAVHALIHANASQERCAQLIGRAKFMTHLPVYADTSMSSTCSPWWSFVNSMYAAIASDAPIPSPDDACLGL